MDSFTATLQTDHQLSTLDSGHLVAAITAVVERPPVLPGLDDDSTNYTLLAVDDAARLLISCATHRRPVRIAGADDDAPTGAVAFCCRNRPDGALGLVTHVVVTPSI